MIVVKTMEIKFIVSENNIMVKDYLKKQNVSRKLVTFIKKNGQFIVNGVEVKNYYLLKENDELILKYQEQINDNLIPSFSSLEVLFEDDYFIICNKPSLLPSHPSRKHFTDTLANRIKGYYIKNNEEQNVHLITRLDAETSGIVLCAKSGYIHHLISQEISNVERRYIAKVWGKVEPTEGLIDKPIAKKPAPDIIRIIDENGKKAQTLYRVIYQDESYSFLKFKLLTGRTHQIRVHLQSIGHPIVGDKLYGTVNEFMYLHCYCVKFIHPITNQEIKIVNLPTWYKEVKDA